MKRSFLAALGLDKETIDRIMKEYGVSVAALKARADSAAPPEEDYRALYEAEREAHQATRDGYAAEKDDAETTELIRAAFAAEGANPNAVELLLKAIERSDIRKKDGQIENWPELCAPVKTKFAAFFGEITTMGANVGSPPTGTDTHNPFAREFFDLQAQTNLFRTDPRRARSFAAAAGFSLAD